MVSACPNCRRIFPGKSVGSLCRFASFWRLPLVIFPLTNYINLRSETQFFSFCRIGYPAFLFFVPFAPSDILAGLFF